MKWKDQINDMQKDALKEVGNIGAGNAATALSNMLNKNVDIEVPRVTLVNLSELYEHLSNPEEITASTVIDVKGEAPGKILMNFDSPSAKSLIESLIGQAPEDLTDMDEMQSSVIKEMGNILCSSYVIALSNFTSLFMETSVPMIVIDMFAAVIAETSMMASRDYDDVIMVETILKVQEGTNIKGFLTMFPEPGSLEKIFASLGLG